ncbi:MAG: tryptophan synthase subunit alpha [Helicobacteraceae bacterium]|jgi:tryptophan synthase alpha chain|nr:tryptophan synthase subunit alpha [Helicobacteraceae bacterium]
MKQLVGYLTPKVPSLEFTIDLANALFDAGMDSLEIGVPFSDPVADGEVIEKAGHIALANGFLFADSLTIANALKPRGKKLYLMGYMNCFLHRGADRAAAEMDSNGIAAALIPDLSFEEAQKYSQTLPLITFVAPTTPKDRVAKIVKNSREFIYLVAYAGVTGKSQSEDLAQTIAWVREATPTPVFVGFGVRRDTAKERVKGADGVIVGSEFVRVLLDDSLNSAQKIAKITAEAKAIKELINE